MSTRTARDTAAHVATRIAALGSTAADIHTALATAGATGTRRSVTRCPVARHLLADAEVPLADVAVGAYLIILSLPDGEQKAIHTPPPVRAFMDAFDTGSYPNLISRGGNR